MSKKKLAGIIIACTIVVIVVIAIVIHQPLTPPGPGFVPVSGRYILVEASTNSSAPFQEEIGEAYIDFEAYIDLGNNGTFCLRFIVEPSVLCGWWTLNANTIRLTTSLLGSPIVWTGTVDGDTIYLSLGDGSVWKQE